MIWKKKVKRTDAHCIFFDLGSDWDFSNIDLFFFILNYDYKKVKTPLDPLSYPSNLHTGPHL